MTNVDTTVLAEDMKGASEVGFVILEGSIRVVESDISEGLSNMLELKVEDESIEVLERKVEKVPLNICKDVDDSDRNGDADS